MIISHKHEFVFFKTGKCAGSSIEAFLSTKICGPEDVCTGLSPKVPGHVARNHKGWAEHDLVITLKEKVPNIYRDYYLLSIERNPWDKVVSQYWHHVIAGGGRNANITFREYIFSPKFINWTKRGRQLYSIDGEVVVNQVMMYHKLTEHLELFIDNILKLNVPVELPNAKGVWRKNKGDYTDMYLDDDMIEHIRKLYAWDIETFGFEYGKQFRKIT